MVYSSVTTRRRCTGFSWHNLNVINLGKFTFVILEPFTHGLISFAPVGEVFKAGAIAALSAPADPIKFHFTSSGFIFILTQRRNSFATGSGTGYSPRA